MQTLQTKLDNLTKLCDNIKKINFKALEKELVEYHKKKSAAAEVLPNNLVELLNLQKTLKVLYDNAHKVRNLILDVAAGKSRNVIEKHCHDIIKNKYIYFYVHLDIKLSGNQYVIYLDQLSGTEEIEKDYSPLNYKFLQGLQAYYIFIDNYGVINQYHNFQYKHSFLEMYRSTDISLNKTLKKNPKFINLGILNDIITLLISL